MGIRDRLCIFSHLLHGTAMESANPSPLGGAPFLGYCGGKGRSSSSGSSYERVAEPLLARSSLWVGGGSAQPPADFAEGAVGSSDLSPFVDWWGQADNARGSCGSANSGSLDESLGLVVMVH